MADIKELMQVRRDKMQKLIDNGVNVHQRDMKEHIKLKKQENYQTEQKMFRLLEE